MGTSSHGHSATPDTLAEYDRLARTWGPEQDALLHEIGEIRPWSETVRAIERGQLRRTRLPRPPPKPLSPGPATPADVVAEQQLLAVALRGEVRPAGLVLDPRWFSVPLHRAVWAALLVLDEKPRRATHEPIWYRHDGRPLVRLGVLAALVADLVGAPLLPARAWLPSVARYLAWHRASHRGSDGQQQAVRVRELHRRRWMIARLQQLIGGWLWDEPATAEVLEQTAARLREMAVDCCV